MTSGSAPLIVDGFRRVRRSTFTGGATKERAEYNRRSRARVAETAKDASRHATPDAPERIDHRKRCTRHDHRTSCRGSRGSASLPIGGPRRMAREHLPAPHITIISAPPIFRLKAKLYHRP